MFGKIFYNNMEMNQYYNSDRLNLLLQKYNEQVKSKILCDPTFFLIVMVYEKKRRASYFDITLNETEK